MLLLREILNSDQVQQFFKFSFCLFLQLIDEFLQLIDEVHSGWKVGILNQDREYLNVMPCWLCLGVF